MGGGPTMVSQTHQVEGPFNVLVVGKVESLQAHQHHFPMVWFLHRDDDNDNVAAEEIELE